MSTFDEAVQKADLWVKDMSAAIGTHDRHRGHQALRAGLHALRDRLPPEEAVQLGAQLPLVVRGLYYEGWKPTQTPRKARDVDDFTWLVQQHLDERTPL